MKKRCVILSILLLISGFIFAQSNSNNLSTKHQKLFEEAKIAAAKGDDKKSIKLYEKLLKANPSFTLGLLNLGGIYYSMKNYAKAEELFANAISIQPDGNPEMYYSLALAQTKQKKYGLSARSWKEYIDREKTNTKKIENAKRSYENALFIENALKNPVPFEPKNLGPTVNSPMSEYLPFLSLDGSAIVFTRNLGQEDFYSSKSVNGEFQMAEDMRGMNTHKNEGAHTLSADGRYMVFTACDRRDAFGGCDLYFSTFENGAWSNEMNMGHIINSAAWDSQPTLSADGKTMYFASNRLGTLGGSDIWMTFRDAKGKWVIPTNLGANVNTKYEDSAPFLHGDGQTMYFTSDGRPGMGDMDVYITRKVEGQWQLPLNLGYPINTEGVEGPICVSLDGTKAFFSSDYDYKAKKNTGNLDILSFEMPAEVRPIASTYIKGTVRDAVTKKTLRSEITLRNLVTNEDLFVYTTGDDGYYITGVAVGGKYAVIAQKSGYLYYTQHIDMVGSTKVNKPFLFDIELQPIPSAKEMISKDKAIVLNNLFFETGSDVLLSSSDVEIQLLADLMTINKDIRVKIIGHTDNVGTDQENLILSKKRAQAVVNALVGKGIASNRLESEGIGEMSPIDTNDTAEGRTKNRRTEFKIL